MSTVIARDRAVKALVGLGFDVKSNMSLKDASIMLAGAALADNLRLKDLLHRCALLVDIDPNKCLEYEPIFVALGNATNRSLQDKELIEDLRNNLRVAEARLKEREEKTRELQEELRRMAQAIDLSRKVLDLGRS